MRNLAKAAVIAFWCWDIVYAVSGAVGCVLDIEWMCSFESALAIIPACVIAALAIVIGISPKRKSDLNYGRELFPGATLRPTFD